MLQTTPRTETPRDENRERYLRAYGFMLRARVLEEKLDSLYRSGKIAGGVFLGRGQEALSAAIGCVLQKGDIFAPLIRDMAGRLAFGETLLEATRTYLGSPLGLMRSRDANIHRGKPREGYYAMISHLGTLVSTVAGGLFARRMRGEQGVVGATCVGDGATSTGSFHEGLNMAAVERLPLVVILANNQFAYSTATARQFACGDLVERAAGYGVRGHSIDGTDPEACIAAVHEAVGRARIGEGPQLVVASLLRLVGHGAHDLGEYVPESLKRSHVGRDCLDVAHEQMCALGWMTQAQIETLRDQAEAEVESAVAIAVRDAAPDPNTEDWCALATRRLAESGQER